MKRDFQPATYIMANRRNGTLYVGATSNLVQRVWQDREGVADGFTSKYGTKLLVWFELHATMEQTIARGKSLKKWNRVWKLELIDAANPDWHDRWAEITGAS